MGDSEGNFFNGSDVGTEGGEVEVEVGMSVGGEEGEALEVDGGMGFLGREIEGGL